jgi:hypothetical protein
MATILTAALYLLLTNPDTMAKAKTEVRGVFAREDGIGMVAVGRLKYMNACLSEALRRFPPIPTGMPRIVPEGCSDVIDGIAVPSGVNGSVLVLHLCQSVISRANTSPPPADGRVGAAVHHQPQLAVLDRPAGVRPRALAGRGALQERPV